MIKILPQNHTVLVDAADAAEATEASSRPPAPARRRFGLGGYGFAGVAALFWLGAWAAWLWGYLGAQGLASLDLQQGVPLAAAALLPPILFVAVAAALGRAAAMQRTAEAMLLATEKLFAADETAARSAARLSRAVRRELDVLNTGLDGAFQRVRSLEALVESQIAALDEAGARAEVRGDSIALRLGQETQRIQILSDTLTDVAARAGETVAGKAMQLRAVIEAAEGSLTQRVEILSDSLAGAAARTGESIASGAAQLRTTIETADNDLSLRVQILSGNLGEAAERARQTLVDGAVQLETTIEAAESKLSQKVEILSGGLSDAMGRANEQMAARAAQMKNTVETAESALGHRIEILAATLTDAAARASETVAGRTAQLRATIETVEGTLKMAAQSMDVQAAGFRAAAHEVAEAPHNAALELARQAARIQESSDAAMTRAEFVLARHEKHRSGLNEQLQKLKDDAAAFETALSQQRTGMENAIAGLAVEAQKFEAVAGDAERRLDLMMANAVGRASQLTLAFGREAEQLRQASEAAAVVLANLVSVLGDAGKDAQALIGQSTAQAKQDARLLVGEAMAECERLLRAAGEMNAEAGKIRNLLSKTTEDMERHLIRLPGLAQEEARRVRQMMASETEQILDLSARTLSTIHARSSHKPVPPAALPGAPMRGQPEPKPEGLKGLARKLTARPKKKDGPPDPKAWEMKALLAAAEFGEHDERGLRPGNAAALGALEMALADLAVDLSALDEAARPADDDWKRYLAGDRAIFARKLAGAIDGETVDRITTLYRDDERFHAAADSYLSEFDTLLARAREGDGGGLLTSTMLSADTGKIYLTIAYALGRL